MSKWEKNTWIGPSTVLDGLGNLKIGSYCDISAGVQIYSHDTVQRCHSRGKKPVEYEPTIIGDYCYIGPNTVIAKGVTIGNGCVIGSHSLVLKSIPPNSKAFGTPCKIVSELELQDIEAELS